MVVSVWFWREKFCSKPQTRWMRRALRVYLLAIAVGLAYVFYWLHVGQVERQFYQRYFLRFHRRNASQSQETPGETGGCLLPRMDPFDPSIRSYLHKVKALRCTSEQELLTELDAEGMLMLNMTQYKSLKAKVPHLRCSYYDVWLADDNHLAYGPPKVLHSSQKISTDTCLVQCMDDVLMWYENVHIYPKPAPTMPPPRKPQSQPSIFLLAVDSMSQPNFIRQLPKTYEYLTKTRGAIVLKGLTKVGDNTFPNIIPLLTGLRVSSKDEKHEFPWSRREFSRMTMDEMPLLWHSFRKKGYLTLYAEDMPQYALFNYPTLGFLKTPVDYYMRPFWMASENTTLHRRSQYYCFGGMAKHKLILRYAAQFLQKHAAVPYFAFAFVSEISHGDINQVQVIDDDVLALIKGATEAKLLEDSIVIVMGDHGNRFDKIRGTVFGRMEERMPFFSIRLPSWLSEKHPHLLRNLQTNSGRLTSWFDVHEMLVDVLHNDFDSDRASNSRHGISLFRQVSPPNRTCEGAGVLQEYCVCVAEEAIPTDDEDVKVAAQALVEHINVMLKPMMEFCYPLKLEKVVSAVVVLPSWSVSSPEGLVVNLRVVVETSPNGALLEGLLQRDAWDAFKVQGDVNRINEYGKQSACIRHAVLRLYCLCRDSPLAPDHK